MQTENVKHNRTYTEQMADIMYALFQWCANLFLEGHCPATSDVGPPGAELDSLPYSVTEMNCTIPIVV